jgi:hypothetical protein
MLASSVSVVVEANFFRDQEADFTALPAHRLMQLHWEAPLPILGRAVREPLASCRASRRR